MNHLPQLDKNIKISLASANLSVSLQNFLPEGTVTYQVRK